STLVFGILPALAPVVGGVLLNTLGWRWIFWMMLVLVSAVLAWSSLRLPETLPKKRRQPLHPRALWANYSEVLRTSDFLLLSAVPTLNFAAIFIYVPAATAYLVDLLRVSTYGFAWLFIPLISSIMTGAVVSGRLAGRQSPLRRIHLGYACTFTGAVLNLLVVALGSPSVPWHVLPLFVCTMGSSIVMPSVTLLLLDLSPA